MGTIAISPLVEVRYPDDWAAYKAVALRDRSQITGTQTEKIYDNRALLSDCSQTIVQGYEDNAKLMPGAEDLLNAFRTNLGFTRIVAISRDVDLLEVLRRDLQNKDVVDKYITSGFGEAKASVASCSGIPFVLEDEGGGKFILHHNNEIPGCSHVWNIDVPGYRAFGHNYTPELIDDITRAVLMVCEELERL